MRLSISIMAHPDRMDQVSALRAQLGDDVPVAWDLEGPPKRDHARIWRNAQTAWTMFDPQADWHLLLQDDAILAPDMVAALEKGLEYVPRPAIVSLYIGTGRPLPMIWQRLGKQADAAGASWIIAPRSMWGVALVLPTVCIPEMLSYAQNQHGLADDMRVGRWARKMRLEAWFPWPSLVDHPDGASIVGHGSGRTALRFAPGSALDWNPAGPVVR
jgi:hypothetical protein